MSRIVQTKRRPALPWYMAGAAWVLGALALPVYELWALALTAALGLGALAAGFWLCPLVVETKELPYLTGSEDADTMLEQIDRGRKALHALDERIPDDALSAAIRRMETACAGILAEVEKHPDKAGRARRFVNHYLPDAQKLLTAYAELDEAGATGENARAVMEGVEQNAAAIATAFENLLDSLYADRALDVGADIEVLKGMLKGQGLL